MIRRTLQTHLERLASQYPVVTLTGPRQSGKTTLARRLADRGDERWRLSRRLVVYGGDATQSRSAGEIVSWRDLPQTPL